MSLKNLSVKTKIPKPLINKLNNKKIIQIYRSFEKNLSIENKFIVAVSGGPDSLALAFLAKIYSIKKKLTAKFLIIDHKLREESTKEAIKVKKTLKKYSINAEILTWKGKKPTSNVQSIARNERYRLLFKKSKKLKFDNILLGHHQDDLFENFFIRILRGSGLKGLISFKNKIKIKNKILLRPLLYTKKDDLIYISKKVFNFYITDPSNENDKYLRIKVRKMINELQKNGLDKKKFNKTIDNLKKSNEVISFYVNENLSNNSFFSKKHNRLILNKIFFLQPFEVVFRSLTELLRFVGKKYYPVRGKKLEKIIKDIENNRFSKATLGGCIIENVNQTVLISKEH